MSNENQGIEYERELVADWKEFGATSAGGTGRGMDLSFVIDNTPINVEVKWLKTLGSGTLDFGQANLVTDGNRFRFTDPGKDESKIQIQEIFNEANALEWVNRQWNADIDLLKIMKTVKTAQEKKDLKEQIVQERGYKDLYIPIDEPGLSVGQEIIDEKDSEYYGGGTNVVNRYYGKKGAQYVQLKHHGLFRLGSADPLGDALKRRGYELAGGITLLNNIQCRIRARIKGGGSMKYISTSKAKKLGLRELPTSHPDYKTTHPYGKEPKVNPYTFTMALKASGYSTSNVDLTGTTTKSNKYTGLGRYPQIIKVLRSQS